ncbi:helix-turn-helix domain-containing protein [Salinimonas lutimaris]|uniref:helix-turn-helix domain-containing protein n=1 Tax=Salinimonas lutimaris TaxID=914153 RepID=UPI0010C00A14|nr:helix-turn-helix domain-containing protein [Salinimonas lutimaris]
MNHTAYSRITRTLVILRDTYADMPAPTMLVLLEVAQSGQNGLNVTQVMKRLGLSQSSASRHCRMLSQGGPNLCDLSLDPNDPRSRLLRLNDNGRALVARLEQSLTG